MGMSQKTRELLAAHAAEENARKQKARDNFIQRAKKFTKVAFLTTAAAVAGIFATKAGSAGLKKASQYFSSDKDGERVVMVANNPYGQRLVRHEQEQVVIENETIKEVVKEVPVYVEVEKPVYTEVEKPVYVEVEKPVYVEQQTPVGSYYTETPSTVIVNQGPTLGEVVTGNLISRGLHALFHHDHHHSGGYRAPAPRTRGGCAPRIGSTPHRSIKPLLQHHSRSTRPVCRPTHPQPRSLNRSAAPRRSAARPCGRGSRR